MCVSIPITREIGLRSSSCATAYLGRKRGKSGKSTTEQLLDIQQIRPAKTPVEMFHGHTKPVFTRVGLKERVGRAEYVPRVGRKGKSRGTLSNPRRAISPPWYSPGV